MSDLRKRELFVGNYRIAISVTVIFILGMILIRCSKEPDEKHTDLSSQDAAGQIYHSVDQMPKQINTVTVEYPQAALDADQVGSVHVKLLLTREGTVEKATVFRSSGFNSLDSTAVEAAGQCLFSAALVDNKPVRMWLYKAFTFHLDRVKKVTSDGHQRHLIDF